MVKLSSAKCFRATVKGSGGGGVRKHHLPDVGGVSVAFPIKDSG